MFGKTRSREFEINFFNSLFINFFLKSFCSLNQKSS